MSANDKLSRALNKSVGKAARDIKNAVLKGSNKALNRASASAKTEMSKRIRSDTGLAAKDVNARIKVLKTDKKRSKTSINVAVKIGIPVDYFKPKVKKVRVVPNVKRAAGARGRPKARTYYGISVKIGGKGSKRAVEAGLFLRDVGKGQGKTIALGRKLAFDAQGNYLKIKTADRPTFRPRLPIVADAAKANAKAVEKHMVDEYEKLVEEEILNELKKFD